MQWNLFCYSFVTLNMLSYLVISIPLPFQPFICPHIYFALNIILSGYVFNRLLITSCFLLQVTSFISSEIDLFLLRALHGWCYPAPRFKCSNSPSKCFLHRAALTSTHAPHSLCNKAFECRISVVNLVLCS